MTGMCSRQSARALLSLALAAGLAMPAMPRAEAVSAPRLSLPRLLEEVRQVNPDLAAAKKRWEAAQAKIPLSKGLPPPKIGVEWEEIPRGTIKVNQATLMYQLIQALPFPGKLSLKHAIAVQDAQIAASQFKQREWEIVSDLKTAYYDLFLLDRESEIQAEQLRWLRQAASVAEARYAATTGTQPEVLEAQARALSASNALDVLANRRQAMAAHLNHLLNRHSHEAVGAPAPILLRPLALSAEELVLLAEDRQPELLAFKYSAERAEAAWKLAKRELLPDLETMIELRDPAMGPIGPWDLSLALVLPFWFWTKLRYGVRGALYDKESAQAAYEAMRNEIAKRIHEHWHEAMAAYQTARLSREGLIPLSKQAAAVALAGYEGGQGSFMQVVDALQALRERQRAYYEALVNEERHVAMLEQAAGIPLREEAP